jgi:alpha-2-macroglobulin
MSTESPSPRVPARLAGWLSRRHWKDAVIALLAVLLAGVSAFAFRDRLAGAASWFKSKPAGAEEVSVFDVVLDREARAFVDILFDKPLGKDKVGDVLDPAPAAIEPALGGFWKWQDTNALRFQPSGGFPVASRYKIKLDPARLLGPNQTFKGETDLEVVTDRFLVEKVDFAEEAALEGEGQVLFRGTIHFNYAVEPEVLATKVKLLDPALGDDKPIEVALETEWREKAIGFRTGAVAKGDEERKVRLVVSRDLVPVGGNVSLGEDFVEEIPVGSRHNLAVWSVQGQPGDRESTIVLTFSSPIAAAVAEKYLAIEPKVAYRPAAERNVLSLAGAFKPGSTYKLKIAAGMPAADDAVLREEYSTEVRLPNLEPSVAFQSEGMFLSAAGAHTVAVETVNVDQVDMTIDRVFLNNLFFLFQYGGFFDEDTAYPGSEVHHALGSRVAEEKLAIRSRSNQRVLTPLTLDRHVPRGKPGLYRVVLSRPGEYEGVQRWLLMTDLGAVAKRGDGEFLVWVSSFRNLAPVEGAKVTLVSDQNQTIGEGRTDGEGIWRLESDALAAATPEADRQTPYMVTIEKGSDFSFLLLDTMQVDTAGLDIGGAASTSSGYTAYLYGERDIYRPGETVEGLAVVRDAELKPAPAMPVVLRWRDPQGRERGTQRLTLDGKGHAPFRLALPAYALTGGHTLELLAGEEVVGQYRFQVEEFVPDRIKVEIVPPKAPVGPGQELAYTVASNYLFGPPGAGLPVETRVRLADSTFSPKGFEAFIFRNAERQLDDREVLSEEGTLDEEGRATFKATMPAETPVPSSLEAVITARVSEQGGRGVAALARVAVHPYPYYLGLRRTSEGYPDRGQPVEVEYVAVAPDGKAVSSGGLRAELYRDRWNTVLRRNAAGNFTYETTRDPQLVDTKAIPGGKPRGTFAFRPSQFGAYRAVLTDPETQASTEVEFYVSGYGYSPWALKNPARLELALDKAEYAPGETAKVQVRAPFAGKLLLTVEREGVLYTAVHALAGNTATLDLPVAAGYRPNAYVTATLVRAVGTLEPGAVGRAFGAVPIAVDRTANRLTVQISAPPQIRPNTTLTIGVKAVPGAVVTMAAVDEGILQLIAQRTPQPFDFFYRKLALGVSTFDTFSLLLPEVEPQGGPAGGGEGAEGMAQHVRTEGIRRVEPVAFWSGPLLADAQGNVKVSFKIPEFQGALRIMAVAIDGDRFGSAEQLTRVRDPIVLLPTLPRVLSFGESFQVPMTVRNDTGRDGTFRVALAVQGPVAVEGQPVQSVAVANGRDKTLYFGARSGGTAGDARFVATAQGNGEQTRATAGVPVRADLPVLTLEDTGALAAASASFPAREAERFRPETLRRELRLGPVPLVQFSGKLRDLLNYPYGCIEQTVSTAFPLIYLGDLARRLDPELFKQGDPAAYLQAALSRIATMQLFDGSFTLWPGGESTHPWGTIYAAHFLVEARRAGHPVEDFLYDGALNYLAGDTKAKSAYGSEELQRTVYSLYVLARAGKADLGTMDFLREKHKQEMRSESRALLAAAYAAVGNPRALSELLSNLAQVEQVERQTGGNWNSTIRNRAIVLLALLDAAPSSPMIPRLVDRLARDSREVTYWNTQESGFTLVALGQFYQRQAQAPPYSGTVYLGNRKVGTFTSEVVTFRDLRATEPLRIQMNAGYRANAAFYSVLTRGVPTDEAFAPSNAGLEVERQFLDRTGKEIDLGDVRQGDLVVIKTRVRSTAGPVLNVVVENLLPSGIEVENPRLSTTEALPWVTDANADVNYLDLRDDRILLFVDLPANTWINAYAVVRAVTPGSFRVPPLHAEAMYNPALAATGPRGRMEVKLRQ